MLVKTRGGLGEEHGTERVGSSSSQDSGVLESVKDKKGRMGKKGRWRLWATGRGANTGYGATCRMSSVIYVNCSK